MNQARQTRQTRQKELVYRTLRHAGTPLTAGELYARARLQYASLAKSTVYRNLEAMLAEGTVTQGLLENGEKYYALADPGGHVHRHHLICRDCGKMEELPECPLGDVERAVAKSCGFAVTDHVLQLYGYCRDCQSRAGEGRPRRDHR